ncbi:hypothetical protein [Bacillus suaedae]|uniref:Uncharacterized protein n=1 Tax=Halalkalibacter suaedae TaxID=2822140 RepID=A0A941AMS1_9BACI|nr:hypothetical protein [Bacillus suaedae]MBP3950845.1 hypothetical protein [Bacillus suaedae]
MSPAWLFVLATVIAVVGIGFVFRKMMSTLEEGIIEKQMVTAESFQKEQSKFFLKIALVEIIPILFVVLGFTQLATYEVATQTEIVLPLAIVIIIAFFGIWSIVISRRQLLSNEDIPEQTKKLVNTSVFIGMAVINAFPIIAIVGILSMS